MKIQLYCEVSEIMILGYRYGVLMEVASTSTPGKSRKYAERKGRKKCFVPRCENSTINTLDKHFFNVPLKPKIRRLWWEAADRKLPMLKGQQFCCEDHFCVSTGYFMRYNYVIFVFSSWHGRLAACWFSMH